jgi:hypothetical protein
VISIFLLSLLLAPPTPDSTRVDDPDSIIKLPAYIEERRIWHEVLHPQPCRVTIEIFASDGKKVRTFLDRTLAGGIYNWHWDALNDSGQYVSEGLYRAVINDCKRPFYESVTIAYQIGEKDFRLIDTVLSLERGIPIRVLSDTLRLSGEILSQNADFPFYTFTDTLLGRGLHSIPLKSETIFPGARVRLLLRTNQVERLYQIELMK